MTFSQLTCIGALTIVAGAAILEAQKPETNSNHKASGTQAVVAITQIIEHAALDLEREGILLALKEAGYIEGKNLKIIYQNAQGSTVLSAQIAQRLAGLKPDVIVAISTPSAQAALSAVGTSRIPIVFTAVTDPVEAKLVKSLSHPGQGVTGVSDLISSEPQLQLIRKLIPKVRSLGVIYNPGETNSVNQIKRLQQDILANQMKLVIATATQTSEVVSAANSLIGRVDAIYIPNDNTAVSSIESIVHIGISNKIPVFAGDIGSVLRGAIGAAGYNRRNLGKKAGEKVVMILKGAVAAEIPVSNGHPIELTINREAARKMGVALLSQLGSDVHWIGEEI